jgi:hypothetical protein
MINQGAISLEIPFEMKDAITVVYGNASCEEHFPLLQFVRDHSGLHGLFQSAWSQFQLASGLTSKKDISDMRRWDHR